MLIHCTCLMCCHREHGKGSSFRNPPGQKSGQARITLEAPPHSSRPSFFHFASPLLLRLSFLTGSPNSHLNQSSCQQTSANYQSSIKPRSTMKFTVALAAVAAPVGTALASPRSSARTSVSKAVTDHPLYPMTVAAPEQNYHIVVCSGNSTKLSNATNSYSQCVVSIQT